MTVELRVANQTDIAGMLKIEQSATSHPWSEVLFISCFSERYKNSVLICDGQLIGFYVAEFVAEQLSLFNIAVSPAHQGRGYGRLLMQHFVSQAEQLNALECWLEVRASNKAAIALYQSLGFNQNGIRRNYYPTAQGHEDALMMAYPLRFG